MLSVTLACHWNWWPPQMEVRPKGWIISSLNIHHASALVDNDGVEGPLMLQQADRLLLHRPPSVHLLFVPQEKRNLTAKRDRLVIATSWFHKVPCPPSSFMHCSFMPSPHISCFIMIDKLPSPPSWSPNSTDLYFWYLCQQTNTKDIAGICQRRGNSDDDELSA